MNKILLHLGTISILHGSFAELHKWSGSSVICFSAKMKGIRVERLFERAAPVFSLSGNWIGCKSKLGEPCGTVFRKSQHEMDDFEVSPVVTYPCLTRCPKSEVLIEETTRPLERCSFGTGPPEFLQGCLCLRVADLERHLGLDRAVECEPARGSGKVRTRGWMCWPSHKKLTWR